MAGMWITRLGINKGEANISKHPDAAERQVTLSIDIWSGVPVDILDRILARLPLQSLLRMQAVCKDWKSKLQTPGFMHLWESETNRSLQRWFLTFVHMPSGTACLAYDVHLSKWLSLPLGFLPFDLDSKSPLAAADGLVCLGAGWRSLNKGFTPSRLVLCNPVTREWRDIPLPPHLDPATSLVSVAGIVVNRFVGTYKLIIVAEVTKQEVVGTREEKILIAFMFDSVMQVWKSYETLVNLLDPFTSFLASQFRAFVGFAIRSVLCSAVCEGVLYCMTSRPHQLHAFDAEKEEWRRLKISLPAEIRGPSLAGRPGRLFLVGAYLHNQHDKASNIGIWELDLETQRWKVIDVLLEATICNHGRTTKNSKTPTSMPSTEDEDVILFVKWSAKNLAYNVTKKSWIWLPDCNLCTQSCPPSSSGYLFAPGLLVP